MPTKRPSGPHAGRVEAVTLPPGQYVEPSVPPAKEIHNAALVYLAMLRLLKKHGTDMITANCGGGLGDLRVAAGFSLPGVRAACSTTAAWASAKRQSTTRPPC